MSRLNRVFTWVTVVLFALWVVLGWWLWSGRDEPAAEPTPTLIYAPIIVLVTAAPSSTPTVTLTLAPSSTRLLPVILVPTDSPEPTITSRPPSPTAALQKG